MKARQQLACAASVGVLLAAMTAHGHGHGHGGHAILDSIPAGSSYSPHSWATAFLRAAGEPRTSCNKAFIVAWEGAEGGNWANSAAYNPLNTTEPEPGSYAINSVGVRAYTSWQEGLQATVATITNGNYPGILSALAAGGDAQQAADAVGASPWGTGGFTADC